MEYLRDILILGTKPLYISVILVVSPKMPYRGLFFILWCLAILVHFLVTLKVIEKCAENFYS